MILHLILVARLHYLSWHVNNYGCGQSKHSHNIHNLFSMWLRILYINQIIENLELLQSLLSSHLSRQREVNELLSQEPLLVGEGQVWLWAAMKIF